jgi:hypothetical protein
MASEGTPGKWSIWATHPRRLGGIAELYATEASVAARAADLRQAGYVVDIFLSRPAPVRRAALRGLLGPEIGPYSVTVVERHYPPARGRA